MKNKDSVGAIGAFSKIQWQNLAKGLSERNKIIQHIHGIGASVDP